MQETTTKNESKKSIVSKRKEEEKNIKIIKEYDRLVVSGTFKKDDKVEIILDNLFTKKTYNMVISKKPYTAMCIDVFNDEETKNGINVTKLTKQQGLSLATILN